LMPLEWLGLDRGIASNFFGQSLGCRVLKKKKGNVKIRRGSEGVGRQLGSRKGPSPFLENFVFGVSERWRDEGVAPASRKRTPK